MGTAGAALSPGGGTLGPALPGPTGRGQPGAAGRGRQGGFRSWRGTAGVSPVGPPRQACGDGGCGSSCEEPSALAGVRHLGTAVRAPLSFSLASI